MHELKLKERDPAPDFSAPAQDGTVVSLSGLRGKNIVLYFYPKDELPAAQKKRAPFVTSSVVSKTKTPSFWG